MTLKCLLRVVPKIKSVRHLCSVKQDHVTTAGILVIGDEILKGQVPDTNSTFMAQELHKLGLSLKKISVVGDVMEDISKEVKHFSQSYDYVLTTGGIGPTHDDVTYAAVALAFDEPLYLNPQIKELCKKFFHTDNPKAPGMKLAFIPKSAKLHYLTTSGERLPYPNVSVFNVYMFPGVPELLKKIIASSAPLLFKSNKKFFTETLYCNVPEHMLVEALNQVVEEFPNVQFGCYPKLFHSVYKVKLTVESNSKDSTEKAYNKLLQLIPKDNVVEHKDDI